MHKIQSIPRAAAENDNDNGSEKIAKQGRVRKAVRQAGRQAGS